MLSLDVCDEFENRGFVGHVEPDSAAPHLVGRGLGSGFVEVDDHDMAGALLVEALNEPATDPAGPTRYDGNLVE